MDGMSLIVKTVTRWVKGLVLLFGVYLVLYGHLTPGGGFSGGIIVACSFILLMLAEGRATADTTLSRGVADKLDSVGALAFLVVALVGMLKGGVFFKNFIQTKAAAHFDLFSAGAIPLSNISIGLKVGMSVLLVFVVLSVTHVTVKNGKREMARQGDG